MFPMPSEFTGFSLFVSCAKWSHKLHSTIEQACCVEYIILESDNLSSMFPNANINLGGIELDSQHLFALTTALAVLPTVWLRDLSVLSYISGNRTIQTPNSYWILKTIPVRVTIHQNVWCSFRLLYSWWSCSIGPGCPVLILGRSRGPGRVPQQKHVYPEPSDLSRSHRPLWLLLLRTCCVS